MVQFRQKVCGGGGTSAGNRAVFARFFLCVCVRGGMGEGSIGVYTRQRSAGMLHVTGCTSAVLRPIVTSRTSRCPASTRSSIARSRARDGRNTPGIVHHWFPLSLPGSSSSFEDTAGSTSSAFLDLSLGGIILKIHNYQTKPSCAPCWGLIGTDVTHRRSSPYTVEGQPMGRRQETGRRSNGDRSRSVSSSGFRSITLYLSGAGRVSADHCPLIWLVGTALLSTDISCRMSNAIDIVLTSVGALFDFYSTSHQPLSRWEF